MQKLDTNTAKCNDKAYLGEIETMKTCLHNQKCPYLRAPGKERPTCRIVKAAIFDLEHCPLKMWFNNWD